MRPVDADSLYKKIKTHTNPYGKPTLDYKSGVMVLDMINQEPTIDIKNEVAKEIFAEIEFDIANLDFDLEETKAIAIEGVIAELKNKYIGGAE